MEEKFEGDTSLQEGEDKEQAIQTLIESFSEEDRELLEKYITLPNQPDIQPEVMQLIVEYGKKLSTVSKRIEEIRQKTGMDYDSLRTAILNQLEK